MKFLVILNIVFLMLGPLHGFAQKWEFTTQPEANFRIAVPSGEMVNKNNEIDHPVFGELKIHHYTVVDTKAVKGEMVYSIFYTRYPEEIIHQDSLDFLEEFFRVTAESAAYSVAGNLVYSSDLQNFHCPGYTFRIHYNQGKAVLRARTYMCCSHLYILSVAGMAEGVSTENMFRFFDSFALIQDCKSVN